MYGCEVNALSFNYAFTQIVLVTVAGLVSVGEAGVERSRPVVLDLLIDGVRHLQAAGSLQRTNSM